MVIYISCKNISKKYLISMKDDNGKYTDGSSPKYKEIESFNPILQKKKKFLRSSRMIGIT